MTVNVATVRLLREMRGGPCPALWTMHGRFLIWAEIDQVHEASADEWEPADELDGWEHDAAERWLAHLYGRMAIIAAERAAQGLPDLPA